MTTTLLTPFDFSNATKVGRTRFRKQILPLRTINYKGQKITFDRPFLQDMVRNFKAGAYDQVPFVLADGENRHNESPENFRGYVADLVLTEDGLDAVLDLSKAGARLVQDNPDLGVSARIFQDIVRNGRKMGKVLRHVCATMDPRVTGMRPWQAVDLSGGEQFEVVDLTSETYQEGNTMPKGTLKLGKVDAKNKTATIDLSALNDEEFKALVLDLAAAEDDVEIDPETGKPVVVKPVEDELDPDEFEGDEEDPEGGDAVVPSTGEQPPATPTQSSAVKKRKTTVEEEAIDNGNEVASLSNRLDAFETAQRASAWATKKAALAGAGVPPFLLDLAEPHMLAKSGQTIDLSNGESVSTTETIDKMLQGYVGMVDLNPEMGHAIELSNVGGENDPDQAYLTAWAEMYGN